MVSQEEQLSRWFGPHWDLTYSKAVQFFRPRNLRPGEGPRFAIAPVPPLDVVVSVRLVLGPPQTRIAIVTSLDSPCDDVNIINEVDWFVRVSRESALDWAAAHRAVLLMDGGGVEFEMSYRPPGALNTRFYCQVGPADKDQNLMVSPTRRRAKWKGGKE